MFKQRKLDKALFKAIEENNADEVTRLLKEGADANSKRYSFGISPLIHACRKSGGTSLVMKILLDAGASIAHRDHFGHGALTYVVSAQNTENIALLLEHGAAINEQDLDGMTPLHRAAWHGYEDAVKFLIDRGADPRVKDHDERTPRDLARRKQGHSFVKFLDDCVAAKHAPPALPAPDPWGWKLIRSDEIANVYQEEAIGYSVTELFNFSSTAYTKVMRNLATNVESQSMCFFRDFPDSAPIDRAHDELIRRGGDAPRWGGEFDKAKGLAR